MSECPHGLEPMWCSVCKHGPTRPPVTVWGDLVYPARFPGRCCECNDEFDPGTDIRRKTVGDRDMYAHDHCAPR